MPFLYDREQTAGHYGENQVVGDTNATGAKKQNKNQDMVLYNRLTEMYSLSRMQAKGSRTKEVPGTEAGEGSGEAGISQAPGTGVRAVPGPLGKAATCTASADRRLQCPQAPGLSLTDLDSVLTIDSFLLNSLVMCM